MNYRKFAFYIALFILFTNCVDQIDIKIDGDTETPVIDGFITDTPKSHILKLTYSSKFSNEANQGIRGARVKVVDNMGNEEPFIEISPGVYASRSSFYAITGRTYSLQVNFRSGESFVSEPQKTPEPVNIQSAYYKETTINEIRSTDNRISQIHGINILTPISNELKKQQFLRFQIIPTWIYEAPRASSASSFKFCYVTDDNRTFNILDDKTGGYDHTVSFIEYNQKFHYGISFSIEQYGMSEFAYDFWENIQVQSEYNGSIFDIPPFSIRGNMQSIDNSEEEMLGFFGVYSVDNTRIFVNDEILEYTEEYNRDECFPPNRPRRLCFYCTDYPGIVTNIKPNFWPE